MSTGFVNLDDALDPTSNPILNTANPVEVEIRLLGNQAYVPDGSRRFPAASGDPRHATFVYPPEVLRISGGWTGNEQGNEPAAGLPSVLSGHIGIADDVTDNCYHVVVPTSSSQQLPLAQWLKYVIVEGGYADGTGADAYGGGIYCQSANHRVIDVVVRDCYADFGGGVAARGFTYPSPEGFVPASFMARRSTFRDNLAGIDGAGLWYQECEQLYLVNQVLRGNVAAGNGGGAFIGSKCTDQIIINAVIHDNVADVAGGGLYVADHLSGNLGLRILNATIAYNTAGDGGGSGIYVEFDTGAPANTTYPGLTRTLIYNSIVYANPGATNADNLLLGAPSSGVHGMDFSNGFLGGWTTASGTLYNGTQGFGLQSIFAATTLEVPGWQNAGARNFRLVSNSRCIDQGTDGALSQSFGSDAMDIDNDLSYLGGSTNEPMPREHYMIDEAFLGGTVSTREVKVSGAGAGALPDIGEHGGQVTGQICDIGAFEYRIYATGP